ncbi:zeta toxin of the postsegregational killing system [Comamonadaceae bacterium OH2310_COT-174]|nr:zeta toxin of the postsegregational killing system [Comamonadaceae bacterium OH2310_COT-174]
MQDPDQYRLSEAEHQAIFERRIKPDLFAGAKSSSQPVAVIFGGQPGAGKSAAVDAAMGELSSQGGAVQIIGDDLRDYHPNYAKLMEADDKTAAFYTDRDTGRWVEKAIAEAKAQRVNIVIEGTMRDGEKVASTMDSLREAGYRIDARALAVSSRLSEQGIMQRYENQKADRGAGRMTTAQAHQAAYDGMLQTLERIEDQKLADSLTIYRRGAEIIYSNELQNGQWKHPPQARAAVEHERARPMTLQERLSYAEGFDQLANMLRRPGRQASPDEISKIAQLQQKAHAGVAAEHFRLQSKRPELAQAYASMKACEAKAKEAGLGEKEAAIVMARIRDNIAQDIEHGRMTLPAKQSDHDLDR